MEPFGQEFCNQGRVGYYRSLNTMVLNMPMVVINGRYEANSEKVDTAIKAALSLDSVAKIDVRRTGSALEISLEGVSSDAKKVLSFYTPTCRSSIMFVSLLWIRLLLTVIRT